MYNDFEYDNDDDMMMNNREDTYGSWSPLTDAIGHAAQGITYGWSDELNGVIGGVGRVLANGIMRAMNQPVNNESFADAWHKGYTDYRDFSRNELNAGYERNPVISHGSEILGSAFSPFRVHRARNIIGLTGDYLAHPWDIKKSDAINALGTAAINGIGKSDNKNINEMARNTLWGTVGNYAGVKANHHLYGSNMHYPISRGFTNAAIQSIPYSLGEYYDYEE